MFGAIFCQIPLFEEYVYKKVGKKSDFILNLGTPKKMERFIYYL